MQEALVRWLMASGDEDPPSLEALLNRPEWHQRARCRGVGVDVVEATRSPSARGHGVERYGARVGAATQPDTYPDGLGPAWTKYNE
jgi:hypothetical protein